MSAQPQRHIGTAPAGNGNGTPVPTDTAARERVVRRMARDDRSADMRPDETHTRPAGSTASADAVEQLRRSIADIKHDVRMLKVGLDKQSVAIERLVAAIEDLASSEEE